MRVLSAEMCVHNNEMGIPHFSVNTGRIVELCSVHNDTQYRNKTKDNRRQKPGYNNLLRLSNPDKYTKKYK